MYQFKCFPKLCSRRYRYRDPIYWSTQSKLKSCRFCRVSTAGHRISIYSSSSRPAMAFTVSKLKSCWFCRASTAAHRTSPSSSSSRPAMAFTASKSKSDCLGRKLRTVTSIPLSAPSRSQESARCMILGSITGHVSSDPRNFLLASLEANVKALNRACSGSSLSPANCNGRPLINSHSNNSHCDRWSSSSDRN